MLTFRSLADNSITGPIPNETVSGLKALTTLYELLMSSRKSL